LGIEHSLARVGSMMTLFFGQKTVSDWDLAKECDVKRFSSFFWGLISRGVYFPCSQFEAFFVSSAHGAAEIDATLDAANAALMDIA
jgi:glutamate-1-semialdehyde 2,1-aminomutase